MSQFYRQDPSMWPTVPPAPGSPPRPLRHPA
jgi:hypothetical protein